MSDLDPPRAQKELSTKGHKGPRRNTKKDQKNLLQISSGSGISYREELCPPGTRASRPHQVRHGLGHLRHLVRPVTAPWASSGLAIAVHANGHAAYLQTPARAPRPPARNKVAGGTPALPGGTPLGGPCRFEFCKRLNGLSSSVRSPISQNVVQETQVSLPP